MKQFFLILGIITVVLISCNNSGKSIAIGNKAITKQQCLSAVSLEDFDTLNKISARNDEPMLMEMIANKTVFIIPNNTVGTVREAKFGKYLFECSLNGESLRLWVSSSFLK